MCRKLIPVGWMVTGLAASLLLAAIVACGCGSDDTRDDARYSSRAKKEKKADRGPPPSELERAAEAARESVPAVPPPTGGCPGHVNGAPPDLSAEGQARWVSGGPQSIRL